MKTTSLLFALLVLVSSPAVAAGGPAAKEAMRTLARERGASWLERIVQISGDRGMDQPAAWHIVATDANGGLREFFVSQKGILSEGPVPAQAVAIVNGPVVSQKKFTLDSTLAFMKANEAAKKAKIGYDTVIYRLRSAGQSGQPVWYLQLNNAAGQKVADVTVSAATGKVSQFLAYNPPPPPPPAQAPATPNAQEAWAKTKEAVGRGTKSVGSGLRRTGEWITRKFTPAGN